MHILSVDQFNLNFLNNIFNIANLIKAGEYDSAACAGKVSANLFYEPSTRTSSSFYSAMCKLGGSVIPINDVQYSSVAKGEDLEDTIRTIGSYSDVIVLRHPVEGSARIAANVSSVPIINAGDGRGEHPTQALLDYFTIREHFQFLDGLRITFVGDLKYGRTIHSLVKLLRMYDVKITFVAPKHFQISEDYTTGYDTITDSLEDGIQDADVVYLTRVQKERHETELDYDYVFTTDHLKRLHDRSVILHPFPRVGEIHRDVDTDPRAMYFQQMRNGLYMRMALLNVVLL